MDISYTLIRKKVKNINLRVRPDGTVTVSAPKRVPKAEIDAFVEARRGWILSAKERLGAHQMPTDIHTNEECLAKFLPIAKKLLPLADFLQEMPHIKVRQMTSCWGVCHPNKGYITLNQALYDKPTQAIEYVILHEFVHFVAPNHGEAFHREMRKRMPDYKERKKLL